MGEKQAERNFLYYTVCDDITQYFLCVKNIKEFQRLCILERSIP